jgi:sugar lactone lactonase YvrE
MSKRILMTLVCLSWAIVLGCEPPPTPAPTPGPAKSTPSAAAPQTSAEPAKPAAAVATPEPVKSPDSAKPMEPAKPMESAKPVGATPLKKPSLLVEVSEFCNSPDGMTILPDGTIIVSAPNYNDQSLSPVLFKITKDNKAEVFYKLPPNPDTGRIGPMGIRVGPSGDLYLCDNQLFHNPDHKKFLYGKSRLLRIPMRDGKPQEPLVVASGLNVANGVDIQGDYIYLTETILVPDSKPLVSGVFRFKLDEQGVKMKEPLKDDPHLVTTLLTHHKSIPFGADGVALDSQGNLFVGNFADGTIHKIVMDKEGKAISNTLFAKADWMKSCDGMIYDPKTSRLYVADLVNNAIQMIAPDGTVQMLAQSPDGDGSDGGLEGPCEPCLRGNELIISNFDFPVEGSVNTKAEKPFTMSVIKLD